MKGKLCLYRKYFENERFRSLFFNNFRMLLSVLLPIIILFFALSFIFYASARDAEIKTLLLNNFTRSANVLNIITETLERDLLDLQGNSHIAAVTGTSREETERQIAYLSSWSYGAQKKLRFLCAGNRLYSSIHIHSSVNDYVISWLSFDKQEEFYDSEWISWQTDASFYARTRRDPFTQEQIISITRPLYQDDLIIGTVVFNLDYTYIDTLFSNNSDILVGTYVITAPDGEILYSTEPSEIGKNISESIFYVEEENTNFQMSFSSREGFALYSFAGDSDYPHVQSALFRVLILGLTAALLLSLLLAVFFSFRLYSYVLDIIESFQHPVRPQAKNTESGIIRSGILNYIDRQEAIESGFAANLASLRKAQIMALQMQITPHFLLNTLQLISLNIMRQLHQDNDSTKLIGLLSDILRNILSTKEYLTDFSSEILLAKKYLEIESIRKQGYFDSTWSIDPRIEQMSAVRCTLQPLLENCIRHGLSPTENTSIHIAIRIALEESAVCVVIEDNGKGIPPQKLTEIRQLLSLCNLPETVHIGLCNVSMRIRLIFGIDNCLSIDSREGEGTKVTLRIPAIPFFVQTGKFPPRKESSHVPHDHSR